MMVYVHKARGMDGVNVYATREALWEGMTDFLADGSEREQKAERSRLVSALDSAETNPGTEMPWGSDDSITLVTVRA